MTSACLSYKSAYQRRHHAEKALADDFPFDLPRLIDGVAPNERENEKCVWVFFFSPLDRREEERRNSSADKHVIISLYVIQALAHSKQSRKLGAHTRNLSSSLDQTHTHTYIMLCCGLNGWTERRASFAKVSVLDRLRRGDEWLIEAQQGCRGNN